MTRQISYLHIQPKRPIDHTDIRLIHKQRSPSGAIFSASCTSLLRDREYIREAKDIFYLPDASVGIIFYEEQPARMHIGERPPKRVHASPGI